MMVSMYITSHREACQQTSSVFLAKDVVLREQPQGGNVGSALVMTTPAFLHTDCSSSITASVCIAFALSRSRELSPVTVIPVGHHGR